MPADDPRPSRGADPDTEPALRTRPRRRGDALNTAIFEAALAELSEVGYARLTMERIAQRAGAGKASLYRRWPNRGRLVMDAVYHLLPDTGRLPDTGSLRGDLLVHLRATAEALDGPLGAALRGILGEVLDDPAHAAEIRAASRGTGVAAMRAVAARAAARGEIAPESVTERRLETGQALMRHHFLFHGAPLTDALVASIIDEVLLPLFAAPPPAPSPAPAAGRPPRRTGR